MRDPKTHAKVLRLRQITVGKALDASTPGSDRAARLGALFDRLLELHNPVNGFRRWLYNPHEVPPYWRHVETIPDTEDDA